MAQQFVTEVLGQGIAKLISILIGVLVLTSCARQADANRLRDYYEISIQSAVWTPRLDQKSVSIWFGAPPTTRTCRGQTYHLVPNQPIKHNSLQFLKLCDEVSVVVGELEANKFQDDSALRSALATHEAFHAAIHISKLDNALQPVDFDSDQPQDRDDLGVLQQYFKALGKTLKAKQSNCSALKNLRRRLSSKEWQSANERARYEWSADYYMVHSLNLSEKDYLDLRTNKFPFVDPADWIYLSGFYAMEQIEKNFSRKDWQQLYARGLSLLQVLYVSAGCDTKQRAISTDPAPRFYGASEIYTK